ncbi:hypothetical protein AN1V17_09500 [Vallitalea sediminicola]
MKYNIKYFVDFVNGRKKPYDDNGHGTKVCGIIAGTGYQNNGKFKGIAPKSNLVVLKALDEDGLANIIDIQNSIRWIIDNKKKYDIKIICLSLGFEDFNEHYSVNPLYDIIVEAKQNGLLIVTSAGNNNDIMYPGIIPDVLTVGSIDYNKRLDTYKIATFSSPLVDFDEYSKPDIYTLGTNLITTNYNNNYSTVSGTSFSAAIVAGQAALFFNKYNELNNEEIKNKIIELSKEKILYFSKEKRNDSENWMLHKSKNHIYYFNNQYNFN